MKLSWDIGHWILLMTHQHWFSLWLGAIRQQAITWANVNPDLCRHMASLGHNEFILQTDSVVKLAHWGRVKMAAILQTKFKKKKNISENCCIWFKISLKLIPKGWINNEPSLVHVMAWRWTGNESLFEPMSLFEPYLTASLSLDELNQCRIFNA